MSGNAARAAFVEQAMWCRRLGSPFTAVLCETIGTRIDGSTEVGRHVLGWPADPSPTADNLPARLCEALHYLARRGDARALGQVYPPAPAPQSDALWTVVQAALEKHAATILAWLEIPPQTNELGRPAVLMSGLLTIAARFGMPVRLLELGSSAGLNLVLDRYGYDLGGCRVGDRGSPLQWKPRWTGPPPSYAAVRIIARQGVDLRPADVSKDGEKLLAYVLADQPERRARLEAALAIAVADPPPVDRGDAAEWLEQVLPAQPRVGAVRVIMHSMALQYFSAEAQRRITRLIEQCGRDASPEAPLAWLR